MFAGHGRVLDVGARLAPFVGEPAGGPLGDEEVAGARRGAGAGSDRDGGVAVPHLYRAGRDLARVGAVGGVGGAQPVAGHDAPDGRVGARVDVGEHRQGRAEDPDRGVGGGARVAKVVGGHVAGVVEQRVELRVLAGESEHGGPVEPGGDGAVHAVEQIGIVGRDPADGGADQHPGQFGRVHRLQLSRPPGGDPAARVADLHDARVGEQRVGVTRRDERARGPHPVEDGPPVRAARGVRGLGALEVGHHQSVPAVGEDLQERWQLDVELVGQHVRGHAFQPERVDRDVERHERPRPGPVPGGGRLEDRGDDLLRLVVGVGALHQDLPAPTEVAHVDRRDGHRPGGEDGAVRGGRVDRGRIRVPGVRRRAGQVPLRGALVFGRGAEAGQGVGEFDGAGREGRCGAGRQRRCGAGRVGHRGGGAGYRAGHGEGQCRDEAAGEGAGPRGHASTVAAPNGRTRRTCAGGVDVHFPARRPTLVG